MKRYGFYTKKVIEHFKNPHNMGKIKNPDGIGRVGNVYCGDVMCFYIKVGKDKQGREIIKNVKFETYGCVAAIATSSLATDLLKGKTLKEALNLKKEDIIKKLGGLPLFKIHCSLLAVDALSEAVYDYLKKKKREIPQSLLKVHQRIEKDKKEIEKRYKEWAKIKKKKKDINLFKNKNGRKGFIIKKFKNQKKSKIS